MKQVKVKFKPQKFKRIILDSIKASVPITVSWMQTNIMKNASGIPVYTDRGGYLSKLLQHTGLDAFTDSGDMRQGFNDVISNMNYFHLKDKTRIKLFDSQIIDASTTWFGIDKYIKTRKTDDNPKDDNINEDLPLFDKPGNYNIVKNGYRPMPVASGGFEMTKNPYSNFGYWVIAEKGFPSSTYNYPASYGIERSYRGFIDSYPSLISETPIPGIRLNKLFLRNWGMRISKLINDNMVTL